MIRFWLVLICCALSGCTSIKHDPMELELRPPKGTDRSQVETVFGKPVRFVDNSKRPHPRPYYVYELMRRKSGRLVTMHIHYNQQGRVSWARLTGSSMPSGIGRQHSPDEEAAWLADHEAMYKEVKIQFRKKLARASWNQKE